MVKDISSIILFFAIVLFATGSVAHAESYLTEDGMYRAGIAYTPSTCKGINTRIGNKLRVIYESGELSSRDPQVKTLVSEVLEYINDAREHRMKECYMLLQIEQAGYILLDLYEDS